MQPVTYVYPVAPPSVRPDFATQTAKALGTTQVIIGGLLIVFQIASIVAHTGTMFVGHGIWTGVIIIVAGAFGIAAGKHKTTCLIITFMVMSIIAATFSVVPVSMSALAIAIDNQHYNYYYGGSKEVKLTLDSVMLLLSLLEVVTGIWSSVICCKVLCCGPQPTSQGQIQVQYTFAAAQPGVQPGHTVSFVPAGSSGMMSQPQQGFMYAAPQTGGYVLPSGPSAGYLPTSGQATGGADSPPPAYNTGNVAEGTAPPIEQKSRLVP